MSVISDIRDMSVYYLADLADCGSPDASASPGGKFLDEIREALLEDIEDENNGETVLERLQYVLESGRDREVIQGAVDYRTHQMWLSFVDLCAYEEELDGEYTDLESQCFAALEQIGQRLVSALTQEIENSGEFDSE